MASEIFNLVFISKTVGLLNGNFMIFKYTYTTFYGYSIVYNWRNCEIASEGLKIYFKQYKTSVKKG